MKISKFQRKIEKLKDYPETAKVVLPAIWLAEETGEVLKPIKHTLKSGVEYDLKDIKDEIGDVAVCLALLCIDLGIDMDEALSEGIDKLKERVEERAE